MNHDQFGADVVGEVVRVLDACTIFFSALVFVAWLFWLIGPRGPDAV